MPLAIYMNKDTTLKSGLLLCIYEDRIGFTSKSSQDIDERK